MSLVHRKGPLVVLLLLALTLAISPVRPAVPEERPFSWHEFGEDGSVRVNLYVFWSETCPHCHRALRFLGSLEKELAWLQIEALEVSVPENLARYSALAGQLGTEARYVPAFFYCGRSFQGYDRDDTTGGFLRQSLERCHAELVAQAAMDESHATEEIGAAPGTPPLDLPLVGPLDPSTLSLPVLTVVLAGLDAFNPCAFFVLLFLLSLMVHARSRARMALVGGVFVLFSGLLYFVFMAAWLNLFLLIGYLPLVTIGAGLVALFVGAINVKDFAWSKKGISLSIPERAKPGLY
jgi:thiol-disulfide isomerase/thioredoxin